MRTNRLSGLLPFAITLALAACGSSGGGGSGQDGAVTGTGGSPHDASESGSGGSSGSGGASGSGSGGASGTSCGDLPPCAVNLYASCTPSGACVQQMTTNTTTLTSTNNICYANGVKSQATTVANLQTLSGTVTITIKKSDGSVCFTETGTEDSTGQLMLTFKDAAGTTVGTATQASGGALTIMCGGQTYTVSDPGNCQFGSSTCTQGTCS